MPSRRPVRLPRHRYVSTLPQRRWPQGFDRTPLPLRSRPSKGTRRPAARRRWEPSQVFGLVVSVAFIAYLVWEASR